MSPIIDILNKDTLEYTNASPTVRGGFGSNLHFKWDPMPPEQSKKRKSLIEPIRQARRITQAKNNSSSRHFVHAFFVLNSKCQGFHFMNVEDSCAWVDTARKSLKIVLRSGAPPLPTVHLGRH